MNVSIYVCICACMYICMYISEKRYAIKNIPAAMFQNTLPESALIILYLLLIYHNKPLHSEHVLFLCCEFLVNKQVCLSSCSIIMCNKVWKITQWKISREMRISHCFYHVLEWFGACSLALHTSWSCQFSTQMDSTWSKILLHRPVSKMFSLRISHFFSGKTAQ